MKAKLIIILTILVALIIAGGIIISQSMKQASIEKQVKMIIDQENKILNLESGKEVLRGIRLSDCLDQAEEAYWSYMELNGTKKDDGSVTAQTRFWDTAKEDRQNYINNCHKQFN